MLSRIARGLYELGRHVERAQHVVRILEVNHKMNLERASVDESNVWMAIAESFECGLDQPDEAALYEELVLSRTHPYSVLHCIENARSEGRAMREHISEEMWIHLNRTHLDLATLTFDEVLHVGRSEFNRRIEFFGNALYGLADDTMIRGQSWAFLRIGKLVERAEMICRILEIKRKSLVLSPLSEGAPVDIHQWQALLRSLSGYEPYRRAYDARIVPERVLEFVMKSADFPRSLTCTLRDLGRALETIPGSSPLQVDLKRSVLRFVEDLRLIDPDELVREGSLDGELSRLGRRCLALGDGLDLAYFTSHRPAAAPISVSPGAALVPQ